MTPRVKVGCALTGPAGQDLQRRRERKNVSNSLAGRNVVVTGVASGLGQALATEFAIEGANVLGCDINDVAGEATMRDIGVYRHTDLHAKRRSRPLITAAVQRFGRLDVMVNSAAI